MQVVQLQNVLPHTIISFGAVSKHFETAFLFLNPCCKIIVEENEMRVRI
jgi:hypothetical protein